MPRAAASRRAMPRPAGRPPACRRTCPASPRPTIAAAQQPDFADGRAAPARCADRYRRRKPAAAGPTSAVRSGPSARGPGSAVVRQDDPQDKSAEDRMDADPFGRQRPRAAAPPRAASRQRGRPRLVNPRGRAGAQADESTEPARARSRSSGSRRRWREPARRAGHTNDQGQQAPGRDVVHRRTGQSQRTQRCALQARDRSGCGRATGKAVIDIATPKNKRKRSESHPRGASSG